MTKLKHRLLSLWYCRNKRIALLIALTAAIMLTAPLLVIEKPEDVSALTVKKTAYDSVTISWKKAADARKYLVYRSDKPKGDYDLVAETEKTSFRDHDKKLKTGKKYYYKVEAKGIMLTSENAAKITARPTLDVPKLKTDTKKGDAKIIIGSVPGAKSYDIYRNGEKIASEKAEEEKDVSFTDETAKPNKEYEYTACARRGSAESKPSEEAEIKIIPVGEITAELTEDALLISWDGNEAYSKYKLYNGKELLTETEETSYEAELKEGEYKLSLVGLNDEMQSPPAAKSFEISEGKLPPEEVIESAIRWGTQIADDNSFHYGRKSKGAQNLGCYFCGTNKPGKCKKSMPADEMEKTWACCEFATACFVHGGGVEDMDCMHDWIGTDANSNSYLKGSNNWKGLGDISYSDLKRGDVVLTKGHTVIYIGDGKCLESHGGDDGHYGSHSWNWSIGVHDYSSGRYNSKKTSVWRYTGDGSGATGIMIREIPDK